MKIDKNSWHYKLWKDSFDWYSVPKFTNLCRYCHVVFWEVLKIIFVAIAVFLVAAMIGFLLVSIAISLYQNPMILVSLIMIIGGSICFVSIIMWVGSRYYRWLNEDLSGEQNTLVGQFIAAKKQKICPLIDFSDEDDHV